jgi:hypothetical protein
MKLEKQVTSLELAQKLKELSVEQNSLFKWFISPEGWKIVPQTEDTGLLICPSAFTVAELGEMLPALIEPSSSIIGYLSTYKRQVPSANKLWGINYQNYNERVVCYENADTEADARAKMLIYLLKNNL